MTTILHLALYLVVAATGWLLLLFAIGATIHGPAWVWAQTRGALRQHARDRSRRHRLLGRRIPPSRDQPVALAPRGGWL